MRTLLHRRGPVVAVFACALVAGCTFFFGPSYRDAPRVDVGSDADTIKRGAYLANHVAGCVHCHSKHDFSTFSTPPVPGSEFGGGQCFDDEWGLPGKVCASNISSDRATGIGAWTDGEVIRAIREGVDREGNTLFPMMPYGDYRVMSDDDVEAIVAYLRTVPAVTNQVEASDIDFPVSGIINYSPQPLEGRVEGPSPTDEVAYGRYLSLLGGCQQCHTPQDKGSIIPELLFSGGVEWNVPGEVHVITPNLTPHETTGIGKLTRENFVGRFKAFNLSDEDTKTLLTVPWERQSIMGWKNYSGMTEGDLGAIYAYLRTVPALENAIPTTLPSATGLERAPVPETPEVSADPELEGSDAAPAAEEAPAAPAP